MATPRRIGGTVWRQEIARLRRSQDATRTRCERMLLLIQDRPCPVMALAVCIGEVLAQTGEGADAVRMLEEIVQEA